MAWEIPEEVTTFEEIKTYRVYYRGEVVLEKDEPLTPADIIEAAKMAGLSGKIDVKDFQNRDIKNYNGKLVVIVNGEVEDYAGDVILIPRFTAA